MSLDQQPTILCADDDAMMLHFYQKVLCYKGYDVQVFANGEDALVALNDIEPSLIILDLQMPGISGLEVLERLRKLPEHYNTPVIIVSTSDSEESISTGLELGAHDYLVKPVSIGELMAKVSIIFKKKALAKLTQDGNASGDLFNDRYEIIRTLGKGGWSTVHYAVDVSQQDKRRVALKIIDFPLGVKADEKFISQFLREAYEHSKLIHPNIVKMYDFGQISGTYFLVTEFVDGMSLIDVVKTSGAMHEGAVVVLSLEIAGALQYMASRNMIHRDVKPDNIIISNTGDAKLLDFGLAKRQTDDTISDPEEFRGTPQVVSPEYIEQVEDLDVRTDVYSLGATLYYALAGAFPIEGPTVLSILQNHLNEIPTPLVERVPDINPTLSELVQRMLAKDREDRPNIDEVMEHLVRLAEET